jgi:nucleolin
MYFSDVELPTHVLLIQEPAKKAAAKPMGAVAKNGLKKGKQESSSDEDTSDESDDDDVSGTSMLVCL